LANLIRLGFSTFPFLKVDTRIARPWRFEDAMAAASARLSKIMLRHLHSVRKPNTTRVVPHGSQEVGSVRHTAKLDTIIDTVNVWR